MEGKESQCSSPPIKPIRKQLQTDENISEKALYYKEPSGKTLQNSKIEYSHIENIAIIVPALLHLIFQSCSQPRRIPLEAFHSMGERRGGNLSQSHLVDICSLWY